MIKTKIKPKKSQELSSILDSYFRAVKCVVKQMNKVLMYYLRDTKPQTDELKKPNDKEKVAEVRISPT